MHMELNAQNIVYSNNEYFDVLDIFFEEQKKQGLEANKYILFSDIEFNNQIKTIKYQNNETYAKRLKTCLEKISSEIILYQHEDMFLYDSPNINKINKYIDFLKKSQYSFVRLARTGDCEIKQVREITSLYEINNESNDFFAVQPTIWKRKEMINFLENGINMSIWDLEINSSQIAKKSKIFGLMHFENENKRGGHYNSTVWPYVATAIIKGKWNFIEYSEELTKIEKIKKNKRIKL